MQVNLAQGGGGAGGARGAIAPHLLGIYVVNFGNLWKFIFRYLLLPPHKKLASAHPETNGPLMFQTLTKLFISIVNIHLGIHDSGLGS